MVGGGGEPNKFNSFDEVIVNFYPSLFFLAFLVRPEVARVVCWGAIWTLGFYVLF